MSLEKFQNIIDTKSGASPLEFVVVRATKCAKKIQKKPHMVEF